MTLPAAAIVQEIRAVVKHMLENAADTLKTRAG
jgi:hypothetical protein